MTMIAYAFLQFRRLAAERRKKESAASASASLARFATPSSNSSRDNHRITISKCYRKSLDNLAPANVYLGRDQRILNERRAIAEHRKLPFVKQFELHQINPILL